MPEAAADTQIDNGRAIVTRWSLPPGASTGLHRHEHDYVVVPVTDGTLEFVSPDGRKGSAELTAGVAYFREEGIEHDVSNPGDSTVVFVETEFK